MSHGTTHPPAHNQSDTSLNSTENDYSKSYNVRTHLTPNISRDLIRIIQNEEKEILGCKHYQRKCKLQANCCQKIVTCRFCHDDVEDHNIVRFVLWWKNMSGRGLTVYFTTETRPRICCVCYVWHCNRPLKIAATVEKEWPAIIATNVSFGTMIQKRPSITATTVAFVDKAMD